MVLRIVLLFFPTLGMRLMKDLPVPRNKLRRLQIRRRQELLDLILSNKMQRSSVIDFMPSFEDYHDSGVETCF